MIALGKYTHKTITGNDDVLLITSQYFKQFKLIYHWYITKYDLRIEHPHILYGNFMAT